MYLSTKLLIAVVFFCAQHVLAPAYKEIVLLFWGVIVEELADLVQSFTHCEYTVIEEAGERCSSVEAGFCYTLVFLLMLVLNLSSSVDP